VCISVVRRMRYIVSESAAWTRVYRMQDGAPRDLTVPLLSWLPELAARALSHPRGGCHLCGEFPELFIPCPRRGRKICDDGADAVIIRLGI